ncbi:MAG: type VII toxin-antitoxin system MntA family adenylyltransferase antitoxin [Desulfomonilaceae bacterium]
MTGKERAPFPSLDLLEHVFRAYANIDAVYLFGSAARGRLRTDSDLDLAIVTRDPSLCEKKIDILADLARAGFCRVDLVFLDVKDIVLRFEAVKHNKVIYKNNGVDPNDFFSKTLRMYSDFLPYLKVQREAFKRRLTGDKSRNHPQETF